MNGLMNVSEAQTMSSREIAELTGKEHDNVRRDILKMAQELSLNFEEKVLPSNGGRPSKVFLLDKENTLILISGYSIKMRAAIIRRWQELESQASKPSLPVPKTMGSVKVTTTLVLLCGSGRCSMRYTQMSLASRLTGRCRRIMRTSLGLV
ncbi:Rha family transcriptional regulator [Salmonella phage JD02]|nr:Rha family transcriptional regulator [Salmonella phage JD02]